MSAPRLDAEDPLQGVMSEIVSAQSSLNMYPDPIVGATGYVSQTDENARHAMEHLHAAFALVDRACKDRDAMRAKLHRMETKLAERRPSDACGEYLTGAAALLGLKASGMDESPQAEDLRDVMDDLWRRLSTADQAHARTLVARIIESIDPTGHDPGDEDRAHAIDFSRKVGGP